MPKFKKDPDSIIKYTIRWGAPDWQASTAYVVNDYVFDQEYAKVYRCIRAHTSDASALQTDIDNGYWKWVQKGLWLDMQNSQQVDTSGGNEPVWTPSGSLAIDSQSEDAYSSTAVISGGGPVTDPATELDVGCQIMTTGGGPVETPERSITLQIVER